MKKLHNPQKIIFLSLISFILFSCEKDYLIPDKDVPDWLKSKINQDENMMQDYTSSCLYAWLSYNWQDEYYFEYHCSCSSSSPRAISTKCDTLHIWANDVTTDYYKEKCCRQLVWKAPNYTDSPW
jgi:hypothetical protein